MPMRIPPDETVVREQRLTMIRVICTLYDRLIEADDGLKAKVKATLQEKGANYAESDLVLAEMRPGVSKSKIDPVKLYKLVDGGQLKLSQFLDCVTVSKDRLKEFLAGGVIDKLSVKGPAPAPSLVTEFKEGVELDVDVLATTIAGALAKAVPIKSA